MKTRILKSTIDEGKSLITFYNEFIESIIVLSIEELKELQDQIQDQIMELRE